MGIKDLNKILRNKCVSSINQRSLSAYMGYRVAIDTSIFLYKFMYVYGNVIDGLVRLTVTLLKNGILPVYILDGKPPKEKSDLLKDRKEKREDLILVTKVLRDLTDAKDENPELKDDELKEKVEESVKKNAKKDIEKGAESSVLSAQDWEMVNKGSVEELTKHREMMERKIIHIRREHIEEVKELMRLMGVPCLIAQSEAESLCAVLCKRNIVDAVLSEDMDVLATGGKVLLKNFTMEKGGSVTEVCLEGVLNELEMKYDQFLDMCILCGCDYTSKIGGIGPMHAYKLMKRYESIDAGMAHIQEKFKVPADFDYITSRKLFKEACATDDFEKYKCDVLQTPMLYKELMAFIHEKAPKLKGKPLADLEELSKEYKNEKKTTGTKVDLTEYSSLLPILPPVKTKYQPTIDNYFRLTKS